MGFIAGDTARGLWSFEYGRPTPAMAGGRRFGRGASGGPAELLTVRALTSAGLAALLLLPLLMLLSLLAQAPLAGPAAIALGYLAMAHAIAFRRPRRAALLSMAVLSGFVAWTLFFFMAGEGPLSWGGLAAVSLAPLFAAAPALARRLAAFRADPDEDSALADIACLERLAPSEAVLFLDGRGTLIGATRAGLASIGLSGNGVGVDMAREFELADRAMILQAIQRCQACAKPVDLVLRLRGGHGTERLVGASMASTSRKRVIMSIRELAPRQMGGEPNRDAGEAAISPTPATGAEPGCDLAEAIAFAMRHAQAGARGKRVSIRCDSPTTLAAAAEQRVSRAVVAALLDNAVKCSGFDTTIAIAARVTRQVALVRVSLQPDPDDSEAVGRLRRALDQRAVPEMVDRAGGSLLVEAASASGTVGIRLALPAASPAGPMPNSKEGM
jgi:hypothetical protein